MIKLTIKCILLICFFSCQAEPQVPSNILSDKEKNITISSLRGYGGLHPENTLLSIEKAIEVGADRIEIDVHQTKDGTVVLMHDQSIDRTTNGRGKIKDMTFEDLKQYSVVSEKGNEPIPTLEETLALLNGRTKLLIEVKKRGEEYPNIEAAIVKLIQDENAVDWCIIQSFEDEVLQVFHDLEPSLEVHKLLFAPYFYSFDKLEFVNEFSIYYKLTSKRLIKKIHKMGKKVNVWTVNEKAKAKDLIGKGVNGIITDYPKLVQSIHSE